MKGYFLLLIHILFFLVSCKNSGDSVRGEYFRYNQYVPISSLDPASASDEAMIWACGQLYNGLVQLDSVLQIQPCLAKSWEISPDLKTYTFHLRDDVYFHDHEIFPGGRGRKMNANDVAFSFSRLLDPATTSSGVWIFSDKIDTATEKSPFYKVKNFKVINETCIQIELKKPVPFFLQLLSTPYCFIVPHEAVKKYGKDFGRHPVGTGPFKFRFWEENIKMVLDRNPHYFEKENGQQLPYLPGVEIGFVENRQTAFLEFIQGKLDFFDGIESSYKDILLNKDGTLKSAYKDKFTLQVSPYLNTEYLGFLLKGDFVHPALKDKRVRQAINYAIDREKMLLYLRNNIGTPAYAGMVPDGMPSYDTQAVKGYHYDKEKAMRLLKEAGYDKQHPLQLILHTSNGYLDLSVLIQKELKEAGIDLQIEVSPGPAQRIQIRKGLVPLFRASWIADYPDAESYLSLFYSRNNAPDGPGTTRYSNVEFDRAYETAMQAETDSQRYKLYQQMDQQIMNDAPVVVLFYNKSVRLSQHWVKGLGNDPMNRLDLRRVRK